MWDDIFLIPFLTGLCLALALPILGCFLRLRDEWLAALAYAHVAAAGALLALVGGIAPAIGGMGAGHARRNHRRRLQGSRSPSRRGPSGDRLE